MIHDRERSSVFGALKLSSSFMHTCCCSAGPEEHRVVDIWLYFVLYADKRRRDAVEKLFKSNIVAGRMLHKHLDKAILRHEVGSPYTALQG